MAVLARATPDTVYTYEYETGNYIHATDVAFDAAGNVYVLATCENEDEDDDVVVIRFDEDGEPDETWVYASFAGDVPLNDRAVGLALDDAGDCFYVLAGVEVDTALRGIHTVKFQTTQSESWLWADVVDTTGKDVPVDIALHEYGGSTGVVVVGTSLDTLNDTLPDIYTRCFQSNGTVRWHDWYTTSSATSPNVAVAVASTPSGRVFVTGTGANWETFLIRYSGDHTSEQRSVDFEQTWSRGDDDENYVVDMAALGDSVVTAEY